ncbi:MAG: hypothetical protein H6726_08775 [Sandaracinaceae bacterium]|nr:hypothetical protein [Myxococcales bacterium]MCB9657725.1 hypothetical protein [Sandaracinaceae bacterium]
MFRVVALVLLVLVTLPLSPRRSFAEGHVPEPMRVDLVRGLGAERGELEANVLASLTLSGQALEWAPEMEWAPLDNLAVELELPFAGRHLEALKPSLQITLPTSSRRIAHGIQVAASFARQRRAGAHVLWVSSGSIARHVAFVTSLGLRGEWLGHGAHHLKGLWNGALFVPLGNNALGVEVNLSWDRRWGERAIVPQAHVCMGPHAQLQLGLGVMRLEGDSPWGAVALLRMIGTR